MANVACIDIAMRAGPPGLPGTLMMILALTFALSRRGGDVLRTGIYGLSPTNGFLYYVLAIALTYALLLPVIPFLPRYLTTSPDGKSNPEGEALMRREIGDQNTP